MPLRTSRCTATAPPCCLLPGSLLGGSSQKVTLAWLEDRGRALHGQHWIAQAKTWAGPCRAVHAQGDWEDRQGGPHQRGTGGSPVRGEAGGWEVEWLKCCCRRQGEPVSDVSKAAAEMTKQQKNLKAQETGSGSGGEPLWISGSTNENGHGIFFIQENR